MINMSTKPISATLQEKIKLFSEKWNISFFPERQKELIELIDMAWEEGSEDAMEDAPDCDSCDEKQNDEPRHNEGRD
jgi:hypothetical protein